MRSVGPRRISDARTASVSHVCRTFAISGESRVTQSVAEWKRISGGCRNTRAKPVLRGLAVSATAEASHTHQ